ncbi:MAG: N-acetyltransferase [Sphingobacteriales bacterium]|nr:MAG: N-acetyltransferase [Sphingobacteriales bacterium]
MTQYNFDPFPILETERLIMRQLTDDDVDDIYYQRTDPQINQYINRPPETLEGAASWVMRINDSIAANESINWGVTLKGSTKIIGGFCFWNMDRENDKGEIGFSLNPPYWGMGLMQEALAAGLQYGTEVMKLQTIEAYTHPENTRSIKLLERNGFKRIGLPLPGGEPYAIYVLKPELPE